MGDAFFALAYFDEKDDREAYNNVLLAICDGELV